DAEDAFENDAEVDIDGKKHNAKDVFTKDENGDLVPNDGYVWLDQENSDGNKAVISLDDVVDKIENGEDPGVSLKDKDVEWLLENKDGGGIYTKEERVEEGKTNTYYVLEEGYEWINNDPGEYAARKKNEE
ncbi:hypothetical protein ACFL21_05040, partial [Patescibacteria group bacterium]